jgi:F-type H+-transporting ATPase subunit epsilon
MAQVEHPKGALHHGSIADDLAHPPGILDVTVVSPARPVCKVQARFVTVAAWDGQIGIWPGHTMLVAALGTGLLRIGSADGSVRRFAVRGGFLKVGGNKVTILVDSAVAEAESDAAEAKRELDTTLESLRHPKTDEEFTELLDRRQWCESRVRLASP